MLGEDVGAAVVLREGMSATEHELGAFLSERLAAYKTPRKILFLAEIPKGATGKLQRIGLAQKLGTGVKAPRRDQLDCFDVKRALRSRRGGRRQSLSLPGTSARHHRFE